MPQFEEWKYVLRSTANNHLRRACAGREPVVTTRPEVITFQGKVIEAVYRLIALFGKRLNCVLISCGTLYHKVRLLRDYKHIFWNFEKRVPPAAEDRESSRGQ